MATTNPWKQFSGLLPKKAQIIGMISSHNDNGTSTVMLRNGASCIANGQAVAIGQRVLIQSREIIREVPALPVFTRII